LPLFESGRGCHRKGYPCARSVLQYRHSTGLNLDVIVQTLKSSKGVVAKYLRLATIAGLIWLIPETLDDAGLEKAALPARHRPRTDLCRTRLRVGASQELKKKSVTLTLLCFALKRVLTQAVGDRDYQYTAFCTRHRR